MWRSSFHEFEHYILKKNCTRNKEKMKRTKKKLGEITRRKKDLNRNSALAGGGGRGHSNHPPTHHPTPPQQEGRANSHPEKKRQTSHLENNFSIRPSRETLTPKSKSELIVKLIGACHSKNMGLIKKHPVLPCNLGWSLAKQMSGPSAGGKHAFGS